MLDQPELGGDGEAARISVCHARPGCWEFVVDGRPLDEQNLPLTPSLELRAIQSSSTYLDDNESNPPTPLLLSTSISKLRRPCTLSNVCPPLRRREIDNRRWLVVVKTRRSIEEIPDLGPLSGAKPTIVLVAKPANVWSI
jgi:hypothetical protein